MSRPAHRVERVPAEVTHPLRQQVLRPHQTVNELCQPGDDDPLVASFAAHDDRGAVVGTAIVRPEPCPWLPERVGGWRLRGMATAEGLRGQGIGAAVLAAALEHAAAHGATLVWCHARTPAVAFYRRAGFTTHGDVWDDPQIGPHIRMWRPLP